MISDILGFEVLAFLWRLEIDQSWEQQDHVSPFIHDRCTTVCTADFAGQFMHCSLLGALVPAEVVNALGEIYVLFVENGSPLERCSCTPN
jgi:hypothetical protein